VENHQLCASHVSGDFNTYCVCAGNIMNITSTLFWCSKRPSLRPSVVGWSVHAMGESGGGVEMVRINLRRWGQKSKI